jgi:hypothetical protein
MSDLDQHLLRFFRTGEGSFDECALELFAYQFARNKPYHAYCSLQGKSPQSVKRWQDIPAVPIAAFKSVALATFPIAQAAAHFESSGTTQQVKSHHYLKTLSFYETSLKTSFSKAVLPDEAKLSFFILMPSAAEAPRSSLSWMMDVVKRSFGAHGSEFVIQRGRLDEQRLEALLKKTIQDQQPVALLGTTIAFLGFFDYAETQQLSFHLPPGSRLMDTGGMKSDQRQVTRSDFITRVEKIIGIPEKSCINEYGMCELGSQFYGSGRSSHVTGPAWTRTLVIDPATGEETPEGQKGLLRHFDLSNVDSVMAIQTEDIGRLTTGGFELLGRDPDADVRGCSMSAEAFIA